MRWLGPDILEVLDDCASNFTFPVLDNGYVYPAAARMSAYSSSEDWGLVIEVFGFSPRAGLPDVSLYTFSSNVQHGKVERDFVSREAYERYLASNRFNVMGTAFPILEGSWQDEDDVELVASGASSIHVRHAVLPVPPIEVYTKLEIDLERAPRVQVFELCRALAASDRDLVLATRQERVANLPSDCEEILLANDWYHPDVVSGELPSNTETFVQLAEALAARNPVLYRPSRPPNTHWRNWPEAGLL